MLKYAQRGRRQPWKGVLTHTNGVSSVGGRLRSFVSPESICFFICLVCCSCAYRERVRGKWHGLQQYIIQLVLCCPSLSVAGQYGFIIFYIPCLPREILVFLCERILQDKFDEWNWYIHTDILADSYYNKENVLFLFFFSIHFNCSLKHFFSKVMNKVSSSEQVLKVSCGAANIPATTSSVSAYFLILSFSRINKIVLFFCGKKYKMFSLNKLVMV